MYAPESDMKDLTRPSSTAPRTAGCTPRTWAEQAAPHSSSNAPAGKGQKDRPLPTSRTKVAKAKPLSGGLFCPLAKPNEALSQANQNLTQHLQPPPSRPGTHAPLPESVAPPSVHGAVARTPVSSCDSRRESQLSQGQVQARYPAPDPVRLLGDKLFAGLFAEVPGGSTGPEHGAGEPEARAGEGGWVHNGVRDAATVGYGQGGLVPDEELFALPSTSQRRSRPRRPQYPRSSFSRPIMSKDELVHRLEGQMEAKIRLLKVELHRLRCKEEEFQRQHGQQVQGATRGAARGRIAEVEQELARCESGAGGVGVDVDMDVVGAASRSQGGTGCPCSRAPPPSAPETRPGNAAADADTPRSPSAVAAARLVSSAVQDVLTALVAAVATDGQRQRDEPSPSQPQIPGQSEPATRSGKPPATASQQDRIRRLEGYIQHLAATSSAAFGYAPIPAPAPAPAVEPPRTGKSRSTGRGRKAGVRTAGLVLRPGKKANRGPSAPSPSGVACVRGDSPSGSPRPNVGTVALGREHGQCDVFGGSEEGGGDIYEDHGIYLDEAGASGSRGASSNSNVPRVRKEHSTTPRTTRFRRPVSAPGAAQTNAPVARALRTLEGMANDGVLVLDQPRQQPVRPNAHMFPEGPPSPRNRPSQGQGQGHADPTVVVSDKVADSGLMRPKSANAAAGVGGGGGGNALASRRGASPPHSAQASRGRAAQRSSSGSGSRSGSRGGSASRSRTRDTDCAEPETSVNCGPHRTITPPRSAPEALGGRKCLKRHLEEAAEPDAQSAAPAEKEIVSGVAKQAAGQGLEPASAPAHPAAAEASDAEKSSARTPAPPPAKKKLNFKGVATMVKIMNRVKKDAEATKMVREQTVIAEKKAAALVRGRGKKREGGDNFYFTEREAASPAVTPPVQKEAPAVVEEKPAGFCSEASGGRPPPLRRELTFIKDFESRTGVTPGSPEHAAVKKSTKTGPDPALLRAKQEEKEKAKTALLQKLLMSKSGVDGDGNPIFDNRAGEEEEETGGTCGDKAHGGNDGDGDDDEEEGAEEDEGNAMRSGAQGLLHFHGFKKLMAAGVEIAADAGTVSPLVARANKRPSPVAAVLSSVAAEAAAAEEDENRRHGRGAEPARNASCGVPAEGGDDNEGAVNAVVDSVPDLGQKQTQGEVKPSACADAAAAVPSELSPLLDENPEAAPGVEAPDESGEPMEPIEPVIETASEAKESKPTIPGNQESAQLLGGSEQEESVPATSEPKRDIPEPQQEADQRPPRHEPKAPVAPKTESASTPSVDKGDSTPKVSLVRRMSSTLAAWAFGSGTGTPGSRPQEEAAAEGGKAPPPEGESAKAAPSKPRAVDQFADAGVPPRRHLPEVSSVLQQHSAGVDPEALAPMLEQLLVQQLSAEPQNQPAASTGSEKGVKTPAVQEMDPVVKPAPVVNNEETAPIEEPAATAESAPAADADPLAELARTAAEKPAPVDESETAAAIENPVEELAPAAATAATDVKAASILESTPEAESNPAARIGPAAVRVTDAVDSKEEPMAPPAMEEKTDAEAIKFDAGTNKQAGDAAVISESCEGASTLSPDDAASAAAVAIEAETTRTPGVEAENESKNDAATIAQAGGGENQAKWPLEPSPLSSAERPTSAHHSRSRRRSSVNEIADVVMLMTLKREIEDLESGKKKLHKMKSKLKKSIYDWIKAFKESHGGADPSIEDKAAIDHLYTDHRKIRDRMDEVEAALQKRLYECSSMLSVRYSKHNVAGTSTIAAEIGEVYAAASPEVRQAVNERCNQQTPAPPILKSKSKRGSSAEKVKKSPSKSEVNAEDLAGTGDKGVQETPSRSQPAAVDPDLSPMTPAPATATASAPPNGPDPAAIGLKTPANKPNSAPSASSTSAASISKGIWSSARRMLGVASPTNTTAVDGVADGAGDTPYARSRGRSSSPPVSAKQSSRTADNPFKRVSTAPAATSGKHSKGDHAESLGATEPGAAAAETSAATTGKEAEHEPKREFDEILSDLEETDRLTSNMLQLRDKLGEERKELKTEIRDFMNRVKEEHGREPNLEEKKALSKPYKRFKALSTELEALQTELSKRKKQLRQLREELAQATPVVV